MSKIGRESLLGATKRDRSSFLSARERLSSLSEEKDFAQIFAENCSRQRVAATPTVGRATEEPTLGDHLHPVSSRRPTTTFYGVTHAFLAVVGLGGQRADFARRTQVFEQVQAALQVRSGHSGNLRRRPLQHRQSRLQESQRRPTHSDRFEADARGVR